MSNKMLIDATHPEETRVVVLRGSRVEEFDFEAADRRQLRGNIYLAKVTRVEPSLQAAFVDYGGNRHGFLAFSEIHPDYYQIPFADRQALLQEQAQAEEEADEAEAAEEARAIDEQTVSGDGQAAVAHAAVADGEALSSETSDVESAIGAENLTTQEPAASSESGDADRPVATAADEAPASMAAEADPAESVGERDQEHSTDDEAPSEGESPRRAEIHEVDEPEAVESVGAEDALEEVPERRKPRPRQYKIQEVIKRRQVLLVQVVKEERGNKGAALTTYLSLAGRYSVLMPNTGRGGGISRKITNPADRKRLKSIASELDVPEGMGVILRTAGANRTKAEVKRDFEYLLRLWENVRELTLRSTAPKLVYEEGSLIKRSIRDLYSREIDQVVVAGDDAYKEAKDFMRMLMPSHARHVQQYKEDTPVFSRNGVEAQLDAMFSPQVTLRSGGYIVINQTEALVSIDVNSGRATREHSIEDTALNTNMEAAEEIARQLRLRDLAGLIVIDFIDMEEKRNNRSVERKLKDCLRADRARIQVGRISHFGLMEMSRQRIRTGVLESSVVPCPHCRGAGQVRSISSLSLQILRALEDHLLRNRGHNLIVRTRPEVALYVLNQKRRHLAQLEARFGLTISFVAEAPENGAGYSVERGAPVENPIERADGPAVAELPPPVADDDAVDEEVIEVADAEESEEDSSEARDRGGRDDQRGSRDPRRRRRRRRGGNGDDRHQGHDDRQASHDHRMAPGGDEEAGSTGEADPDRGERAARRERPDDEGAEAGSDKRRRRGRRGGRRRGRGNGGGEHRDERSASESEEPSMHEAGLEATATEGSAGFFVEPGDASEEETPSEPDAYEPSQSELPGERPQVEAEQRAAAEVVSLPEPVAPPEPAPAPEPIEDDRPKRSGWWSRKGFL